tara:strand:- start:274 stop:474 length:201 start_codon:yes stop_codon:yes gene_type:complete
MNKTQRLFRAAINAVTTSITQTDGVRIMAIFALIVAALQKYHQTTARPVDTGKWQYLTDKGMFTHE